jgi:hypothetical protein
LESFDFSASAYHPNWIEVRWRSWGVLDVRGAEAR